MLKNTERGLDPYYPYRGDDSYLLFMAQELERQNSYQTDQMLIAFFENEFDFVELRNKLIKRSRFYSMLSIPLTWTRWYAKLFPYGYEDIDDPEIRWRYTSRFWKHLLMLPKMIRRTLNGSITAQEKEYQHSLENKPIWISPVLINDDRAWMNLVQEVVYSFIRYVRKQWPGINQDTSIQSFVSYSRDYRIDYIDTMIDNLDYYSFVASTRPEFGHFEEIGMTVHGETIGLQLDYNQSWNTLFIRRQGE